MDILDKDIATYTQKKDDFVEIIKREDMSGRFKNAPKYIWGTGSSGRMMHEILGLCGIDYEGFIDNEPSKAGNTFMDKKIYQPCNDLLGIGKRQTDPKPIIFVPSQSYRNEIIAQLKSEYCYPNEKIIDLCRYNAWSLMLMITSRCNLNCHFCSFHGDTPMDYNKFPDMSFEYAKRAIDQAAALGFIEARITPCGEPLVT